LLVVVGVAGCRQRYLVLLVGAASVASAAVAVLPVLLVLLLDAGAASVAIKVPGFRRMPNCEEPVKTWSLKHTFTVAVAAILTIFSP
jgi:hypothetical protein